MLDEATAREVLLALSASTEVMKATVEVELLVLKKPATVVFRKAWTVVVVTGLWETFG